MGCNTSSEAKPGKEVKAEQNHKEAESEKKAPAKEEQAATKIQAVFRGHQTRKSMSMKASGQGSQSGGQKKAAEPEPTRAELEAEFRADDKELCNAATKIQASFRGHQSRKQVEQQEKEAMDKSYGYHDNEDRMMRPRLRYRKPLTFYDNPPPLRVRYSGKRKPPMLLRLIDGYEAYPYDNVFEPRVVWPERRKQKSKSGFYRHRRTEDEETPPLEPIEQPFAEEQNREKLSKFESLKKDVNCATCLLKEILDPDLDMGLGPEEINDRDNDKMETQRSDQENESGDDSTQEQILGNVDPDDSEVIMHEQPQLDDSSEEPHKEMPEHNMHEEEREVPDNSEFHWPSKEDVQISEGNPNGSPDVPAFNGHDEEVTTERSGPESETKEISPDENAQPESMHQLNTHVEVPDAQSEPKNVHAPDKSVELRSNDDPRPDLNNGYVSSKDGQHEVDDPLVPAPDAQSGSKDQYKNDYFSSKHGQPKIGSLDVSGLDVETDPDANYSDDSQRDSTGSIYHEFVGVRRPKKFLRFKIHDAVSPLEVHMPFHYKYVKMLIPSISPMHLNVMPQCVHVARKGIARDLKLCHRSVWRKISIKNRVILNMPSHHCVETVGDDEISHDLMVLKTNTRPVSVKTNEPSWLSIFGSYAESPHINSEDREDMLKKLDNWALTRGNTNVKRSVNPDEDIFGVSE